MNRLIHVLYAYGFLQMQSLWTDSPLTLTHLVMSIFNGVEECAVAWLLQRNIYTKMNEEFDMLCYVYVSAPRRFRRLCRLRLRRRRCRLPRLLRRPQSSSKW
jgi:hypothetical protein